MKKLILCSLFVILTSCTAAPTASPVPSIEQDKVQQEATKNEAPAREAVKGKGGSCICAKIWMPVCGENKKTYGNACEADCAGVKHTGGACAETK